MHLQSLFKQFTSYNCRKCTPSRRVLKLSYRDLEKWRQDKKRLKMLEILQELKTKYFYFETNLRLVKYNLGLKHSRIQVLTNLVSIQRPKNFLFVSQIQSANLSPLQRMVEDINDQASDFTANSVALSTQTLSRLEDINTR